MTDEEILEAIKSSVHTTSATGIFLNHALCVFAQQPGVDIPLLIDGIRNLRPCDGDTVLDKVYEKSKQLLISNLEETLKQRSRDQTPQ